MKSYKGLCKEYGLNFESVKMEDMVGETVEVHGFKFQMSEEHGVPFVVLDVVHNKKPIKVTGGCAVLKDKLEKLAEYMPFTTKIIREARYYDFS